MTVLSFPWPPPQLMPNYKRSHHWSAYRKHCNRASTLGWGLTVQEFGAIFLAAQQFDSAQDVHICIIATPPKRPGPLPDEDNLIGACKHYLDGISRALGVNDRQFRLKPVIWEPKAGAGEIKITF